MQSAKDCILQTITFLWFHAYAFLTPTATNNFWQSWVPRLTRQKNITPQKTGKPMILILFVCPTQTSSKSRSSGKWCHAVWCIGTNISKKSPPSIYNLRKQADSFSAMLVSIYQIIQHNIPEALHIYKWENLLYVKIFL